MKTILEHLESLPEPYRTQAIENCMDFKKEWPEQSAHDAIVNAFYFCDTTQGSKYWYDFLLTL